ncbi:MAG: permease prefix domain 1-containing protein [Armatimonadota bacterium]
MTTHPFDELTDAATAGLADDREVYLDVRQELRAHLQDKQDYLQRQGHDAAESTELAVKAFGSPLEVADELLQANKARLSLRALARLGIRALLIPATVLLALWVAWDLGQTIRIVSPITSEASGKAPAWPPDTLKLAGMGRRTEEAQLLLYGDLRRNTKAEQLRAIWERHQGNKAYFANYALALYPKGEVPTAQELALLEREYRLGERIDPANALYNYLLADAFFTAGGKLETVNSKKRPARGQSDKPVYKLTVTNRSLLDRAMDEMMKGAAKPRCTTYTQELYRERLGCIQPSTRFAGAFAGKMIAADFPFMSTFVITRPGRALPLYVRVLEQEGKTERAQRVLAAWLPFISHWTDASTLMVQSMILRQLLKNSGPDIAAQYEHFADLKRAAQVRRLSVRAAAIWGNTPVDLDRLIRKQGGYLAGIYLPRIGGALFSDDDLIPSRLLEYTLLEEAAVALVILLLLYAMLRSYLLSVRWYHGLKAARSAPLLLLPPFPALLRVALLGIVLPLGLYLLYLHVPALSGRGQGLSTVEPFTRLLVEVMCITAVLLVLPGWVAKRYLRRRCDDLGIDVPEERKPGRLRVILLGIGGLFMIWLLPKVLMYAVYLYYEKVLLYTDTLAFLLLGAGVLTLLLPLKVKDRGFGLYHGSVARSLVPVYALAVILIGGLAYPYLVRQEARLVRQETLFLPTREPHWPGKVEYRFVQDAREKLQAAFGESGVR